VNSSAKGGIIVQEKLQLLKELQALDIDRQALLEQRQSFIGEQGRLQSDLERVQAMVDSLSVEIGGLEEQRREFVQALALEGDNIARSESRLPQIKTQKEYVAVLKEVDTAKKLSKELTEKIEVKDRELASLAADKAEKDEELASLDGQIAARRGEISTDLAGVEAQLEAMTSQRGELLEKLPTSLRKRYQLLLERRGGVAVVEARGGACLGCHMHLPPQQFNSLYVAEEVQSCPHCNRLLYVADKD
jgi:predicted  nucleic acid-binding Zn-ribbon protein